MQVRESLIVLNVGATAGLDKVAGSVSCRGARWASGVIWSMLGRPRLVALLSVRSPFGQVAGSGPVVRANDWTVVVVFWAGGQMCARGGPGCRGCVAKGYAGESGGGDPNPFSMQTSEQRVQSPR